VNTHFLSNSPPMRSSLSSKGWICAFSLEKYEKRYWWKNQSVYMKLTYSAMRNAKSKLLCLLSRFNVSKSNASGK
jgi:hypothetical protein